MRAILVAALILASTQPCAWPGSNRSKGIVSKSRSVGAHVRHNRPTRCTNCERDASRSKRDPVARKAFKATHPCPATGRSTGSCPGYVIDHIVPLKRNGPDAPENMVWQTTQAARVKDKVE